jgi:iron complex transport system ATP-binding protein
MIARIIVQETRIIFMDEPVSHLDFNNQIRIIKLLKNMVSEGYSIIISLHDPNFAFLAGDEFLLINDGKIMKTDRQRPWENNEINQIFGQDILKINYKDKKLFIPDL